MTETIERRDSPFSRGSNQSGLRAYNERLVLTLIRRHGPLAKAHIARRTGLSAQTISVIMRELEAEGLLLKGEPIRGKVGQPLVPMRLNPDGAYFFGLKIGRRSFELVLVDFMGDVVERLYATHSFPMPEAAVEFARDGIEAISRRMPSEARSRIAGLGVGMPFHIWEWATEIGIDPALMDEWRQFDVAEALASATLLPVCLANDATSACSAELVFGRAPSTGSFMYFYIGYFIGGGVVLNGSVFSGPTGNAGAVGSMPVLGPDGLCQLIDVASLARLEALLAESGQSTDSIWSDGSAWDLDADLVEKWLTDATMGLAQAITASLALIDFEQVIIDGWMPEPVRDRIVARVRSALMQMDMTGLNAADILPGSIGKGARSLGAASLPLSERFLLDTIGTLGTTQPVE